MIKYYLFNNQIVPLYVFKNSTLEGEKLKNYLQSSPVKMAVSTELGAKLFSQNIVDLGEVNPEDISFTADVK